MPTLHGRDENGFAIGSPQARSAKWYDAEGERDIEFRRQWRRRKKAERKAARLARWAARRGVE